MDEIVAKRRWGHRLFGFWTRRRATKDQETIEVLSDPAGRHDVRAAQAAQRSSQAKAAGESGRGGTGGG